MNSKVSVIIATYNRSDSIFNSIKSVFNQTFKDFEIIIIDDGSTDNTKNLLKPLIKENKIIYFYKENSGPGSARDFGIKKAKGKYIAILDSDDYWIETNKLKKQVIFLEKNLDYVLVGGGIIVVDKKQKEIVRKILPITDKEIRSRILIENPFVHSTVLYRKKAWQEVGGYGNRPYYFSEDWNLWLNMGKFGKFYNINDYLTIYTQCPEKKYSNKSLLANLKFKKKYRYNYPNYFKGLLFGYIYLLYYNFPFKKMIKYLFNYFKK